MSDSNSHTSSNVNQFNLFLDNNTGFIHEKYDYHYDEQFPIAQLLIEQKMEKSLKFIYDIFSFQKYESKPKLNTVLRNGLTQNIKDFVQQSQKKKKVQFNKLASVELLKFCIENNDMFAVQYDKKKKKEETHKQAPQQTSKEQPTQQQPPKEQSPKQQPPKPQPPKQQKNEVKQQRVESKNEQSMFNEQSQPQMPPYEQKTRQPKSQAIAEKHTKPVQTPKSKKLQFSRAKERVTVQSKFANQFQQPVPQIPRQQNPQLIRKQLKNIFDFYCKQQQNVTPNSTFDIINHKCQTMNLGKFLFFAVATNIVQSKDKAYSQARLDKKGAMALFKRLAEGQRQIDFRVFLAIMEQIHKNDERIYLRMGLGEQGARGQSKIIQNLKYFNLPFSTRDQTGRESSPHGRTFVPKLTTHSGMIEQSLKQQLVLRKERPYFDTSDRNRGESKTVFRKGHFKGPGSTFEDPKQTAKFTLKLGQSHEGEHENLKFLSKLITHEQNDEIYLKDYYLPAKRGGSNKQKGLQLSLDERVSGRYTKQELVSKQFGNGSVDYTSRPRQQLVLPLINQKNAGMLTERRSLGVQKRNGYRL